MTHFISGGLNETALWLANESLQPNALDETMRDVEQSSSCRAGSDALPHAASAELHIG